MLRTAPVTLGLVTRGCCTAWKAELDAEGGNSTSIDTPFGALLPLDVVAVVAVAPVVEAPLLAPSPASVVPFVSAPPEPPGPPNAEGASTQPMAARPKP